MVPFALPRRCRSSGLSMVEVLAALAVLGLGLLSVGELQLVATRSATEAGQRQVAGQLAVDLIERLRANAGSSALTAYATQADGPPVPACRGATPCTPGELAAFDRWEWQKRLSGADGLAQGRACLQVEPGPGGSTVTLTLVWRGASPLPAREDGTCAVGGDYGAQGEYRRTLALTTFVAAS